MNALFGLSLSLANPWGLAALGFLLPVLLLHILKPRRQTVTVSSVFLWRSLERPVSSAVPWQKLRWSALLFAQLFAVLLGALALARPVSLTDEKLAEHTVFVIDASGSMAALDGSPTRLDSAKAKALALRSDLPEDGVASVIVAGDRSRVVLTASGDKEAFADSLRAIAVTEGHPDFVDAFALAESLDSASSEIGYILLSDGGLTADEQKQMPPGLRYERIGSRDLNRAITRLTVEPRGSGLHAIVTTKNLGGAAATQTLRVDVDGETAASTRVELKPGGVADVEFDLPAGDQVEAFLEGDDLLPLDNRSVAVAGRRPAISVGLVGEGAFIGDLLRSIPGVTLVPLAASDPVPGDVDVMVYAGVAVPAQPPKPYIAIAPPGGTAAVNVTGLVEQPALTLVRDTDSLIRGLDFSEVGLAVAQRVTAANADVLIAAEGAPLLIRGVDSGRRFVYLSFHLGDSNLPVQVAFPLLGDRMLTDLSGVGESAVSINVGMAVPLVPGVENTVLDPGGRERLIAPDASAPTADRSGFWTITNALGSRLVAVNPATDESLITPADQLEVPRIAAERAETFAARGQNSLLHWVLWPLLGVLAIEWLLARHKLGVSRRQWRFATAARMVVAGLLLGALLAPNITRTAERTATVFVLDDSASLGAPGRSAAAAWVADAIAARQGDDIAGVVSFGAEARLDRLMQAIETFDRPGVLIDESASNLEAALRLGAAVLPEDARRRIVLVSDGRQTSGEASEEIETLREAGIPVDVVVIDPAAGADAAIASLDVPRLARVGDAVPIIATVTSTRATEATVVLLRDGTEIDRQQVDLVVGENTVRFADSDPSSAGAISRYQVRVESPNDAQTRNDAAFAAVPIDGPARVLIVEGSSGDADTLEEALTAAGLVTEKIPSGNLPDALGLATYSSIVLVDVDARELSNDQVAALDTAVRDLGRGLVTVGGEHSYGVGGYRASPLEDLLPVVSEILDPKRRKRVAEVLSIDTSESMGDCHCADGENPEMRPSGGVNKTDIARAAAARAIASLTETDEIGVVAWNSNADWIIDLQALPPQDVIDEGLGSLRPSGATNIAASLDEAAEALLNSDAAIRHIILFSDGFTDERLIKQVAEQAAELNETEGITVSVVATGEGAAPLLKQIADNGKGRFYPGRDLRQIPQIIAEEAVIASRDFVNEGEFLPEVTATVPATESLTASPPLLGYVATTAKGTATTALRIGPDRDPLLVSWQAGLGTVTSWTSDATVGWSQQWAAWDGFVGFWGAVVKDTFPTGDVRGAAQATLQNGTLHISVEGSSDFPDGATAVARVAGPDGQRFEVPLERSGSDEFSGSIPAPRSGSYAVTAVVSSSGEIQLASSAIANESYPAEFRPGAADRELLLTLSEATGGRGEVLAEQAFDTDGLVAGKRTMNLRWPFLLAAVLLWPIAVALSRLSMRGASFAGAAAGLRAQGRRIRSALPSIVPDPVNRPAQPLAQRSGEPHAGPPQSPGTSDASGSWGVPTKPTANLPSSPSAPNPATPTSSPAASGMPPLPKPAGPAPNAKSAATAKPAASPSREQPKASGSINDLLAAKRRRQSGQSDEDVET